MKYIIGILLLLASFMSGADNLSLNTNLIADSLIKNANAVVRYDSISFRLINEGKAEMIRHKVITILNDNGEDYADIYVIYDRNSKVSSFSGEILNEKGERIRKIKKNDITDHSLVGDYTLFQDERYINFEGLNNSYPYTITVDYKVDYNGIVDINRWIPIPGYNVSVEKSRFTIISPNNLPIFNKKINLDFEGKKNNDDKNTIYQWGINNRKAYTKEPFSPSREDIFPILWSTPERFEYEGTQGKYDSWKSFGKWEWELIKNKQELSESTINDIRRLIQDVNDNKEKAKRIYTYFQNKTRYISVQLGIGGWEPFPASVVDEVGYGDCKALSNYMISLLKVAGIDSYYAIIGNGNSKIKFPDFPSMGQANHVIICLPLESDTTWLECTNQEYPFGYIGTGNADRFALLISEAGGKLVKTPKYERAENIQVRNASVELDKQGNAKAFITTNFSGLQYSNRSFLLHKSKKKQKEWYLKNLNFNSPVLTVFNVSESQMPLPTIAEELEVAVPKYCTIAGNRIFIKPNILNSFPGPPSKVPDRQLDVELNFAFTDIDTVTYILPENFVLEAAFDDVNIRNEFGTYSAKVLAEQNKLVYIRKIEINNGIWPPEKYVIFQSFYSAVWKADQAQIVYINKGT